MTIEHWVKEYKINPKLMPFINMIEERNNALWISRIQKRIDEWKKLDSVFVDLEYEKRRHIVLDELEGLLKELP